MKSMSQHHHHYQSMASWHQVATGASINGAATINASPTGYHHHHLHQPQAHHYNQISHLQNQQNQEQAYHQQSANSTMDVTATGERPPAQVNPYGGQQGSAGGASQQLHSATSPDQIARPSTGNHTQTAPTGYLSPGVCRKNSPALAIKSPADMLHSPHQPVQNLQEAYQDLSVSTGVEQPMYQQHGRLAGSASSANNNNNYYELAASQDCNQDYYLQQQLHGQHRVDNPFQHHQSPQANQHQRLLAPQVGAQCWPNLSQSTSPHMATSPTIVNHHQFHLSSGHQIAGQASGIAGAPVSPYHSATGHPIVANYSTNGYHHHHHHHQHYANSHQHPSNQSHAHHQAHQTVIMQPQQQQQQQQQQHQHHQRASQQQLTEELYAVHHPAHQQHTQYHANYGQFPAQSTRGSSLMGNPQHSLPIGAIKQATSGSSLSHQLHNVPQILQNHTPNTRNYSSGLSSSNQIKTATSSSSSSSSSSLSASSTTTPTTTTSETHNCRVASGSGAMALAASTSPKPLQNRLGSPATSVGSGLQQCRQSSSVISTSSAGSNLSDHQRSSPTDSPASASVPLQSTAATSNDPSTANRQVNPLLDDRLLANDTEQDSKETQLSQLHQQCAALLDEQQHFVAINSPNLNANNGTTNATNSTATSHNNNNNNTTSTNSNNSTTSNGNNSTGRSKRLRTSFKHNQLKEMKRWFSKNQNPDAKDLKTLAQTTGLSKRVLQVWFQNARAKFRRNNAKVTNQQHYDVNQHHTSHMMQFHSQQQPHHHQQNQQNYHHHPRPLATDQSMGSQQHQHHQANQHHHLQASQVSPTISSRTFVPIAGTQLQVSTIGSNLIDHMPQQVAPQPSTIHHNIKHETCD